MDITKQLDDAIEQNEKPVVLEAIYGQDDLPYLAPDGSNCTMPVLGKESKAVKNALEKYQRHASRNRGATVTDLRITQAAAAVVAAAKINPDAWHGWTLGDEVAECTFENVSRVLRAVHILEQVEAAVQSHASFFKSGATR